MNTMKQTRRRFVAAFVSGALIMPLSGLMLPRQALLGLPVLQRCGGYGLGALRHIPGKSGECARCL
jgi:hypothetical protein